MNQGRQYLSRVKNFCIEINENLEGGRERQIRIPMALPHLSTKVKGTKYLSTELTSYLFSSSSFSESLTANIETLVVSPCCWLSFLNSRNLSIGSHDWSKLSKLSCGWSCSYNTDCWSANLDKGLRDQRSWLLKSSFWKDEGFLFACRGIETRCD